MHKQVNVKDRAENIRAHLIETYPEFGSLFRKVNVVNPISPSSDAVPEAVVRIVIMQMLSEKAANTIYQRVKNIAKANIAKEWELST